MNQRPIKFCPYCGIPTELKQMHSEAFPTCPACGWVAFPDPKVAAAVLIEQGNAVLLTQRSFKPGKGKWTLPAGFVNAFEDPAEAAARECLEETGLEVEIGDLLMLISGREHEHGADIVLVYSGSVQNGQLKAGDDAAAVKFFDRDQLPPLAFKATRKTLDLA